MNIQEATFLTAQIKKLGGVCSLADFANLLGLENSQKINAAVRMYEREGLLARFINGFYIAENFSPEVLAQKIYPDSYLSLGTALAKNLVIGSVPKKTIYAVKTGKKRIFDNGKLRIIYFGIQENLSFGWKLDGQIKWATPEKAFIDLLYYYQKGFTPSFNIFSDLNLNNLQVDLVKKLLTSYKNKKFRAFVMGVIDSYGN